MSEVLQKIRTFMENQGIPGRDAWDLPTSEKRFADGAHYRIEIAGVERASTMEALIDEAHKRNVTIHRAIAAVGGATYCDLEELKAMAAMARGEQIEVIMTVGHRKGWDTGAKEISTSEGAMQGFRLRGSDNISYHIADIMRCMMKAFCSSYPKCARRVFSRPTPFLRFPSSVAIAVPRAPGSSSPWASTP